MLKRHLCLPCLWLMTDERMGDHLLAAIAALPKGAGVIFRHYGTERRDRQELFTQVSRLCRKRRLKLVLAGADLRFKTWELAGHHGHMRGAITCPVHSIPERIAAERANASLIFVSPVFKTKSHPGADALGRIGLGRITQSARLPVIALGGMTARKARSIKCYGWAAIDGLMPGN